MKRKQILAFALALMLCVSSSDFTVWAEETPTEPQKIVQIWNLELFSQGILLPVGGQDLWEKERQALLEKFSFFGGITENEDCADITAESMDFSDVDITSVGDYTVTIRLKVTEEYAEQFFLPEALATVNIPVHVAAPTDFAIYALKTTNKEINVRTLYPTDGELPISVYFCSAETELAPDELALALCADDSLAKASTYSPAVLTIYRSALTQNAHYYFQVVQNGVYSNILHLVDDGKTVISSGMEGDRDGGDTDGNAQPDLTQPPPAPTGEPPANKPAENKQTVRLPFSQPEKFPVLATAPPVSTKTDAPFLEHITETTSTISGARLRMMTEDSGRAMFSKQGASLSIPAELVAAWSLRDEDLFFIELTHQNGALSLSVQINEQPITNISGSTLKLQYTTAITDPRLMLLDKNGETISTGSYDREQKIASFVVSTTGKFTVLEETDTLMETPTIGATNEPSKPDLPITLPIVGSLGLFVVGGFLFYQKKRK